MKNVTVTLPEQMVARARVVAAAQGKSLSKFISDLVVREIGTDPEEQVKAIERFLSGPGWPGVAAEWRGREALYAEREDELLHRHQRSGLRGRRDDAREAVTRRGLAETDDQEPYTGPQPAKPK
jgi:hypothetical protein